MGNAVAFVLKGYPRLSETFISQEILALEKRGLDIRLYSLRHPTDKSRHPIHDEISAKPHYLPEYLYQAPVRVARAWKAVRGKPGYGGARNIWLADLKRDPSASRVRRFGQALVLAHELPTDVGSIHAHFLHTPASVARYAAHILGLPWSCSAHAKDIWTSPQWELKEKLADCHWLATCTRANAAYLSGLASEPERVELIYHGLDFSRFLPPEEQPQDRNGSSKDKPVRLICVGRSVEKKGHAGFLAALAKLPKELNWHLELVGGGELLPVLKKQARRMGLADRIIWSGALSQKEVLARYRSSDLFVLNSRIAADGDRDGLPNVLMEAQSQNLACLSTAVSAIPELIEDQVTGILVPPDDDDALAENLKKLISNPDLRRRLAEAAFARVHQQFDLAGGIEQLAGRFNLPTPPTQQLPE